MADEHWGRYKTIAIAIAVALVGHIILIIAATPWVITNPSCSVACFALGLVVMGVGVGGFKSNISPLIAEQYKQITLEVKTLPSGERVILDPTLTVSRIYMYFYMMINIGALCGSVAMVYAEVTPPGELGFTEDDWLTWPAEICRVLAVIHAANLHVPLLPHHHDYLPQTLPTQPAHGQRYVQGVEALDAGHAWSLVAEPGGHLQEPARRRLLGTRQAEQHRVVRAAALDDV